MKKTWSGNWAIKWEKELIHIKKRYTMFKLAQREKERDTDLCTPTPSAMDYWSSGTKHPQAL